MNKIKLLFTTSRPISWVNTAYPFAAGYLMMGGAVDWRLIIGTLFFLIPYNLAMYGINDVFDYESDILNPRKGGVEGAITPKQDHPLIIWTALLLSLPFIVALMLLGSPISALVLAAVMFFVVAYSAKGLRFKEVPFLDSITSSIHFVGPLVYAYTLVGASTGGWIVAFAFFAWGIASQAFGAVQDIEPDREAHIRSIATELGAARTVRFSFFMYLFAALLIASLEGIAIIVAIVALSYAFNTRPFLRLRDDQSRLARAGWKRFLWLNYVNGAVVTIAFVITKVYF